MGDDAMCNQGAAGGNEGDVSRPKLLRGRDLDLNLAARRQRGRHGIRRDVQDGSPRLSQGFTDQLRRYHAHAGSGGVLSRRYRRRALL